MPLWRCCFPAVVLACAVVSAHAELVKPSIPAQNATKKAERVLTGIPQVDYKTDPNLPHELKGYDLSEYPFYKRLPENMYNFSCEDRHDGFYASIPHKCQVYHNCLFSQRYDFLCANYTAFDQANFICHFVSEVDCENSEKFYDRNNELYIDVTTTTSTTTTAAPQVKVVYVERDPPGRRGSRPNNRHLFPSGSRRRRPPPQEVDYYYDYYDPNPSQQQDNSPVEDYYYYEEEKSSTTSTTTRSPPPRQPIRSRIRNPEPSAERVEGRPRPGASHRAQAQEDYVTGDAQVGQHRQPHRPLRKRRRKRPRSTTTTTTPPPDEYYDYYYYYDDETTTTTAKPKMRIFKVGTEQRRLSLLRARNSSPLLPRNVPDHHETGDNDHQQPQDPDFQQARDPGSQQKRDPTHQQTRDPDFQQARDPGSQQKRDPTHQQTRDPDFQQARDPGSQQKRDPTHQQIRDPSHHQTRIEEPVPPPQRQVLSRRRHGGGGTSLSEVEIVMEEAPLAEGVDPGHVEYDYEVPLSSEPTTKSPHLSVRRAGTFVRPRTVGFSERRG